MLGSLLAYVATVLALPWGLTVALVVAPLVLLELALRPVVGRATRRFEQRLMELLPQADEQQLLGLYNEQRLLRFAAPRYVTLGKLGLILSRLGAHKEAAAAYAEAVEDAPADARYTLALGLATSQLESGALRDAELTYRAVIDDEHVNVQACRNLAQLILERDGDAQEAEDYLRKAVEAGRGGAARGDLVRLLAQRGKSDEAAEQLGLLEREAAGSDDAETAQALARARQALG